MMVRDFKANWKIGRRRREGLFFPHASSTLTDFFHPFPDRHVSIIGAIERIIVLV